MSCWEGAGDVAEGRCADGGSQRPVVLPCAAHRQGRRHTNPPAHLVTQPNPTNRSRCRLQDFGRPPTYGAPPTSGRMDSASQEPFTPAPAAPAAPPPQATAVVEGRARAAGETRAEVGCFGVVGWSGGQRAHPNLTGGEGWLREGRCSPGPPSANKRPPPTSALLALAPPRLRQVRELDVRAASAGLPRIKPHWTHRWGAWRLATSGMKPPARSRLLHWSGAAWPIHPLPPPLCRYISMPHFVNRYMKLLLVGESGLGKTTFVRNLFAAYARDASFPINDASVSNADKVC